MTTQEMPKAGIKLPEDLFDINNNGGYGDYISSTMERAKLMTPKIRAFIESMNGSKSEAIEAIEDELYQRGSDPEEALLLIKEIYKNLLLAE